MPKMPLRLPALQMSASSAALEQHVDGDSRSEHLRSASRAAQPGGRCQRGRGARGPLLLKNICGDAESGPGHLHLFGLRHGNTGAQSCRTEQVKNDRSEARLAGMRASRQSRSDLLRSGDRDQLPLDISAPGRYSLTMKFQPGVTGGRTFAVTATGISFNREAIQHSCSQLLSE